MNRDQALDLAALINVVAPWIDDLFALPVNPREQRWPEGPYLISLSSGFLRLRLYESEDLADVLRQIQPPTGPSGFPLLDRERFDEWVLEQLTRTDLTEAEQLCGHGELEIYCYDPENRAARVLVELKATMAPVVDGNINGSAQGTRLPSLPEIMLTVSWACPVCTLPLHLTKRMQAKPGPDGEYRLFASPIHLAQMTEKRCPANVWVEISYCEQDSAEFDELEVKVWQIIHRDAVLVVPGPPV